MLENYLKITWKVLRRNKFFTFVSLFGITFTIGISLVLTTFYDNMLGAGYPEVHRARTLYLSRVSMHNADYSSNSMNPVGLYFIETYIKQRETPEMISFASMGDRITTFVGNKKLQLSRKYTCENFWKTNAFEFLEGQPYTRQQIENREPVAVITASTREQYFGGKASVVGERIAMDNSTYRVIGVVRDVPGNFVYAYGDCYVPYTLDPTSLTSRRLTGNYLVALIARTSADFPKIKEEFADMVSRIELPAEGEYTQMIARPLTPLETISISLATNWEEPPVKTLASLLLGTLFLFMLLPALNLVNLNASRIMERASEIGVRKAFGASTATLAMQFVIENILLTLMGGVLGFFFAVGMLAWIQSLELIPHIDLHLNYKVFFIAVFLCVFFGVLSGVLPALRMSKIHIVHALKGHTL